MVVSVNGMNGPRALKDVVEERNLGTGIVINQRLNMVAKAAMVILLNRENATSMLVLVRWIIYSFENGFPNKSYREVLAFRV